MSREAPLEGDPVPGSVDPDPEVDRERSAVLLGAATPWGAVLARTLAREGWSLVLVDPPGDTLEAVREAVVDADGSAETLSYDPADLPALLALPSRLPPGVPRPSLLVHALPPPTTGPFAERTPEDIGREANRGYSVLVSFARGLLPGMIERGGGSLIALGSAAASAPLTKAAVHSGAALALPTFLTALDREVVRQGIRTSYLEPQGYAAPPLDPEVAEGAGRAFEAHRRFQVSEAAVARAFSEELHRPSGRHRRFRGHDRPAPSPEVLRRYVERELHARHPEPRRVRRPAPPFVPEGSLRGQIAVVTGGSRGIGREIARRLGQLGMRVVLTARDTSLLAKVAKEVEAAGGQAVTLAQDLLRPEAAANLRKFTVERWGSPRLVVNNAGLGYFRRLVRQTDLQLTQQLTVDLLAPLAISREFLPGMLGSGRGHLLTVGSMAAEVALPRLAPYSGIKGALKGFSLALGREVYHRGLQSSVLEPITVRTDFIGAASEQGRTDVRETRFIRSFIIGPEEVGRVAERTLLRPRPVVMVPPRARAFYAFYRTFRPLIEPSLRLPPARRRTGPSKAP